ncbi:hypothetical protein [Blastopirellula marina]|uniref:TIGR03067 domain-containing protein n=1 Tax=Blastopirellula marina TaxID=124 RepID=A0A2S8F2Q3_9BACT|nr:hypothetical protein [Blastopirellula marina]PQO26430.1 hypothetical protein C5Y98_30290 [Blastopirellula marina]PQO46935.1 hypothetical protein C5Y93_07220 [Blastopirellula marina]PTL40743.1 hypothetical protein C5Y97_30305 [Blastopirellula marina]
MSRYLFAVACSALLLAGAPLRAEEPGEGLIDGLISEIRELQDSLKTLAAQVDKNAAVIDRTADERPQLKMMAELAERLQQLGARIDRNSAMIERVAESRPPKEALIGLMERLEKLEVQVDRNAASIDQADALKPQKKPKAEIAKQEEASLALNWKPAEPIDYSGVWLMTLPLGAEHEVMIKAAEKDQFKLIRPRLNMAGVYQADGGTLKIVRPDDKRLTGFVWTAVNRNTLVLTGEPPTARTGSSYLGATLTRQVEPTKTK